MKTKNIQIVFMLIALAFSLSNCTLQDRKYRKGYYVDWSKKHANKAHVSKQEAALTMIDLHQEIITDTNKKELLASVNNLIIPNIPNKAVIKVNYCVTDTCGDIIVMMDGSAILVKILEISETEIKYKKCNNIEGPLFVTKLENVSRIEYINGTKETIKHTTQPNYNSSNKKSTAYPSQYKSNKTKEGYNPLAIASLVMGILSFSLVTTIVTAPLAFIFGLIAKKQLSEGRGNKGEGMATFGITIGIIFLSLCLLILLAILLMF